MSPANQPQRRRRLAFGAASVAILGGVAALVAALASANSFTLRVEKNAHVTNATQKAFRVKAVNAREAVAVGPAGYAVYTFQGETTHHLICHRTSSAATNCFAFWPPVSPASASSISKQSGIKGRLGTFRHQGTMQLTLNGQPLYYFTPDLQAHNKRQATGDELKTFGSIWHVVTAGKATTQSSSSPAPTTPTTTTSSPAPYSY